MSKYTQIEDEEVSLRQMRNSLEYQNYIQSNKNTTLAEQCDEDDKVDNKWVRYIILAIAIIAVIAVIVIIIIYSFNITD